MPDPVIGQVSLTGQLVTADPPLLRLLLQAGSNLGEPLAVPSLAAIVRLALTLSVPLSRSVVCASGEHDLELIVLARPDSSGVALSIRGWNPRPARQSWLTKGNVTTSSPDFQQQWTWATNDRLEVIKTSREDIDLIGQTLSQIFRLIDNEFDQMPIILAAASRTDFADQPALLRAHPEIEMSLSGVVFRDAQGSFGGFSGIAVPRKFKVTENADRSQNTNAFTEKLNAALRVPLSRIVASADNISARSDGPLRNDYVEYAGDIASAARHLMTLVDDLAELQTVGRFDFRIEAEEVDLADLARQAAGLLKVRASARQVRIDSPPIKEILRAQGDYRRVLQILLNLIGNAIRYSPDDGMIWIRLEHDADTIVLIIADQGRGIATADHARIFDKFERVDPSEPGGSGLGLFISRRLAQAMGGDIVVDSAPGQGARFILTLPAA